MSTNPRPIGVDLFAGAGGLSLGFEQAGFDVVAAVEIDPIHAAVHEFNFPKCKTICRNVEHLSGDELRRIAGLGRQRIDVVFGGAPCQGFSMIGKRAFDDPRNSLVRHFVRLVVELEASYFVFENVKGLTLGKHKEFLRELIASFGAAGHDVVTDYRVLNAAEFGVPQDRRRLFLLGCRRGMNRPEYPEPTEAVKVRDALSDLPNADDFDVLRDKEKVRANFGPPSQYAAQLRGIEQDPHDFGYKRQFDTGLLTASLRTEHTELSRQRFLKTAHGKTEPISRFHKLHPDGVCNTIRAGTASDRGAFTSPRPIHPDYPRVITVREAARLHSYPDWFRFHSTKWHGFRQIGNSVPPKLGRAVASALTRAMSVTPNKPTEVLELGDERLLSYDMSLAARHFHVSSQTIAKRTKRNDRVSSIAGDLFSPGNEVST